MKGSGTKAFLTVTPRLKDIYLNNKKSLLVSQQPLENLTLK